MHELIVHLVLQVYTQGLRATTYRVVVYCVLIKCMKKVLLYVLINKKNTCTTMINFIHAKQADTS